MEATRPPGVPLPRVLVRLLTFKSTLIRSVYRCYGRRRQGSHDLLHWLAEGSNIHGLIVYGVGARANNRCKQLGDVGRDAGFLNTPVRILDGIRRRRPGSGPAHWPGARPDAPG
jgi:hypothetical protein